MPKENEFDLDELKASIKQEAEAIGLGEAPRAAPFKGDSSENVWNSVSYLLDSAGEHGQEVTRVPAMMYRHRLIRPIARFVARTTLFLTKFIRVRQADFNLDIVQALRSINSDGYRINEKLTELSTQLAAVSEAVEDLSPNVVKEVPGVKGATERHQTDIETLEKKVLKLESQLRRAVDDLEKLKASLRSEHE